MFKMRRLNNLVTLFSAMFAFFFGCFISTTLTNIDKCSSSGRRSSASLYGNLQKYDNDIFLFIVILTAPNYFERRQTIRDTWLQLGAPLYHSYYPEEFLYLPEYNDEGFIQLESVADQQQRLKLFKDWQTNIEENDIKTPRIIRTKHLFIIGTNGLGKSLLNELEKEQKQYNDILFLKDLHDSYTNLTQKLLLTMNTLVNDYNFNYILKVDDDTYIKLDYLLNELLSYDRKLVRLSKQYHSQPLPELYWGYFNGRAQIKTRGQWKETNFYLCDRYIPYALGGGYIISRQIAEYIEQNSQILSTYISEDISLGTWISGLRNIYRRHDVRFDTGYMPRKCRNHHIVLHKRTTEQMKDLYQEKLCTFELPNEKFVKRPAEYFYDWKKPVDKCCDTV